VITVEHLTKTYTRRDDRIVALDEVSMQATPGAVLGVLGSSGAGKSTLARCLALRERPDRGAIKLDGTDLLGGGHAPALRRQLAVVGGTDTLFRQRTVAGNVALPLEQAGLDGPRRKARVGQLLGLVGLANQAGARLDQLSAGQRRRVVVARALSTGPTVLLADEPTGDMDSSEAGAVLTVLDRARAELGVTVLLFTSDSALVRRSCDEVALLEAGKLVEHGNLRELAADPLTRISAAMLPAINPVPGSLTRYDLVAEVVLVGFAAVGALLPEAANRFEVDIEMVGGGLTRFGDTPVARFGVGLSGARAESALAWIAEAGGVVHRVPRGPRGVAA
jgi:D-methionine transport system ATP-binding protein